jgi:UDP-N-acetylmuramyl pentapeptide phosphotransferase/UDP-N-acetylglucosamine-1-phosphate transferase
MGTGATAWIPLLCAPLAVVGMVDDRYDLPAALRYAVQLATAVALVAITPLPLPLWFLPVVVVAVTAVINFFNFMDGLDGLVALCGAILMLAAGLWPVAGALLGFLAWNWSPAKLFMGDVGSIPLGFVIGWLLLSAAFDGAWAAAIILPGYYWADATLTLLRRAARGEKVWRAHRSHFYQRAVQAGASHATVATSVLNANVGLVVLAAFVAIDHPWIGIAAAAFLVANLLRRLARP